MLRLLLFALLAVPAIFFAGCHRSNAIGESNFYGSWVRDSTGPADTLVFFNRNGKNLLRYNNSYNPAQPAYTEIEYAVKDEKLYFPTMVYPAFFNDYATAERFTWIEPNRKFKILANELWRFLNAFPLYATFRKLEN
ncbi:MAG TPA: hypothetical protein VLD19_19035 [Chitinophagaceae bacterium]|nr:hypothetical protein [Chitinophagaceae bacterium]